MQGVEGEELGRDGLGVYLCMYGIRGLEQNMYYVVRILCSQQGSPVITNVYACYMYGEKKHARFCCPCCLLLCPLPTWAEMVVQRRPHHTHTTDKVRTHIIITRS